MCGGDGTRPDLLEDRAAAARRSRRPRRLGHRRPRRPQRRRRAVGGVGGGRRERGAQRGGDGDGAALERQASEGAAHGDGAAEGGGGVRRRRPVGVGGGGGERAEQRGVQRGAVVVGLARESPRERRAAPPQLDVRVLELGVRALRQPVHLLEPELGAPRRRAVPREREVEVLVAAKHPPRLPALLVDRVERGRPLPAEGARGGLAHLPQVDARLEAARFARAVVEAAVAQRELEGLRRRRDPREVGAPRGAERGPADAGGGAGGVGAQLLLALLLELLVDREFAWGAHGKRRSCYTLLRFRSKFHRSQAREAVSRSVAAQPKRHGGREQHSPPRAG